MEENRPELSNDPTPEDLIKYVFASSNLSISPNDLDIEKYNKGIRSFDVLENEKGVDYILYMPQHILLEDAWRHLSDIIQAVKNSNILVIDLSVSGTNNDMLFDQLTAFTTRHHSYEEIWVYYPDTHSMQKIQ